MANGGVGFIPPWMIMVFTPIGGSLFRKPFPYVSFVLTTPFMSINDGLVLLNVAAQIEVL